MKVRVIQGYWLTAALMLAGVTPSGAQPQEARAASARALHALEVDSVESLRAEWEQLRQTEPPSYAAALGLATLDALTYRYDEAARRFALLRDSPADSALLARAALGEGRLLQAMRLQEESREPLHAAARIAAAIRDSATHAEALIQLAPLRARTDGLPEGLALLDSAVGMIPAQAVGVRARERCTRALIHARSGRGDVLGISHDGAALSAGVGDRRTHAVCIFAEAQYFAQRGDLIEAEARLDSAAMLQRESRDHAALASVLQWRGYLLTTYASYGLALRTLHEAIDEAERSGNRSALAWAHANVAQIRLTLDDRHATGVHAGIAEPIMRSQRDPRGLALVHGIRSELAIRAADTVEASRLESEIRRINAEFGLPAVEYAILDARFRNASKHRDWATAHAMLDSMDANLRRRGATGWIPGQNFSRLSLALLEGDYPTAQRLLATFGDTDTIPELLQRYELKVMQAELHAHTGSFGAAEQELRAASNARDAWRRGANATELRHLAFQRVNPVGDPDFSVATVLRLLAANGRAGAAFELGERRRARQLGDALARATALRDVRSAATTPVLAVPTGITARDIAAALPDDETALVEYVTGRRGEPTTAFIVTRRGGGGRLRSVELAPVDSVAPAIARFVGLLEAGGPTGSEARLLGAQLLDPVLNLLPPGVRRLMIVPDDVLHRLPFAALRLADGRYAMEQFSISTMPSAAVAAALLGRSARTAPARMLAFGDPSFAEESAVEMDSTWLGSRLEREAGGQGGGALVRLVASGIEAERAARFAAHSSVRLRESASEYYLKAARLDTFDVIHFATHAFVDNHASGNSALVLAAGDGEDGFVTPGDVAALRLQAQLVVLSACRTAGGVLLGGEGVHGLAAAFLEAGARAVVATAWRVDDDRAAALADRFYRALADGEPMGDALRIAKLEALRAGLPPREWASWVLIGDPIAGVTLRQPPASPWPWIAAVAIAVALVLAYGVRMVKRSNRETRSPPLG